MTYKTNINDITRGVYYAGSGDDTWNGLSIETPKLSIPVAMSTASDLLPTAIDPVFVKEAQGGSFIVPSLTLVDSVLFEGLQTTIILTDAAGITSASFVSFNIQTVVGAATAGSVCLTVDGEQSFGARISAMVVAADNGVAIDFKGLCGDEIFITPSQIQLRGDGSIAMRVTAEFETPADININTVLFKNDNTVLLDYDPPNSTDVFVFELSTATPGSAGIPTGTKGIIARNGIVVAEKIGVLNCVDPIEVKDGAIVVYTGSVINGDITVDVGGVLLINATVHEAGTVINNGIIKGKIGDDWYDSGLKTDGTMTGDGSIDNPFSVVPVAAGDMLKSEYDVNDIGIVDGAQKITDFAILPESVTQGDLLYIVDAPLSPEGFPVMGIADSEDALKRPAVAVASESGAALDTIKVIQNGFVSGIDTSAFAVNEEVFLSRDGKITAKTKKFRQQVGTIKDSDVNGSMLFNQGDIVDHGKLLGYARDSGGISVYTSGPQFSGSIRRQVFQEVGPNQPQAMVTTAVHVDEVQQAVKAFDTANPSFTLTPEFNNNILGFILEAATTIDNVIMEVFAGPVCIWQNNIGTLIADVETGFTFTNPDNQRVPIDLFAGVPYTVNFSSDDGDVILKGTVGGDPFYALTWDDFEFRDILSSSSNLFELESTHALLEANYITQNAGHTSTTAETVGRVDIYQAEALDDTVTDGLFTPGVASVSDASVITDGANVFTTNQFILLRGFRDNNGLYEVGAHLGNTLFIRGVGNNPTLEAFTRDQFDATIDSGTITHVNVSVWRTSLDGSPEHGRGEMSPLTYHVLAHAADVPIVATEEFASTNARFFGELGVPAAQTGWTDAVTGSATIDLVTQTVFGTPKQVVRHNDDFSNGSTTSNFILTAQNWIDINDFGASYSGTARMDSANGFSGFFSGLQADVAENPVDAFNRRYGIVFDSNLGNLRLIEADNTGNNITMDGTGGNPLIQFDTFFNWECVVPVGLGAAQVYINGSLTTFVPTFFINGGGLDTVCRVSSGSTGGTNRVVYHDNFGVTIYEEAASRTLQVATMAADIGQVFIPEGRRDYLVVLPDGNPRKIGSRIDFVLQNIGGKLKVRTQNVVVPQALFNGRSEVERDISSISEIRITNTVDASNIYVGFIDEVKPLPIRTITEDTVLTLNDATILADDTAKSITVTLPTAVGIQGRIFIVKKSTPTGGPNNVTVDTIGAETINNLTSITLTLLSDSITVQSDGADYQIIGSV